MALIAHLTTGFLAIMRRHRDRLNDPDTDNDRRPQHYQLLKHIAEIISTTSEETGRRTTLSQQPTHEEARPED